MTIPTLAPGSAPYYQQLQTQPDTLTTAELKLIHDSSYYLALSLRQVDKDATALAYAIQRVTTLPQYTQLVADLAAWQRAPLVKNVYHRLIAWQQFPTQLEDMAAHARTDAITWERVQKWYRAGVVAEHALHALYVPQSAAWIHTHLSTWLWLLAFFLASAVGGWVGAAVLEEPAGVPAGQGQFVQLAQRVSTIIQLKPRHREPFQQVAPAAPALASNMALLVCTWANGQRQHIYLGPQGALTIGSGPTNEVRTTPGKSASEQVVIRLAHRQFYAQALDRQWPTTINGRLLSDARVLRPGDTLVVGDVTGRISEMTSICATSAANYNPVRFSSANSRYHKSATPKPAACCATYAWSKRPPCT